MTLPAGFQFSQSNLQDYVDCPRRFQLRSLLNVEWPAVNAEPTSENERYLHLGSVFHHLVRQHQLGLPVERLAASIRYQEETLGDELWQWWENYQTALLTKDKLTSILSGDVQRFPEYSLSVPLGDYRLVANYDLYTIDSLGKVIIFDWKTNRKRPPRSWLLDRIQTRVYPFLAVKASIGGGRSEPIPPEDVEMCYWFANYPTNSEYIDYSQEQYIIDELYLLELIEKINHPEEDFYPLTHNEQHCKYCVYRSLCDRGVRAGNIDEGVIANDDNSNNIKLEFDFIDEIEF